MHEGQYDHQRGSNIRKNWRKLGSQLGFSAHELDEIAHKYDPLDRRIETNMYTCFSEMLRKWLNWYPKDSRGSTSYPRYSTLIDAMNNTGYGNVVQNLALYEEIIQEAKDRSKKWTCNTMYFLMYVIM